MIKSNLGTRLQLGDNSTPVVFADIPELRNIPPIEQTQEKIDATTHPSSANRPIYRKSIPSGLIDPGDYEFEIQTDRANAVHQMLFALLTSQEERKFRLIYPDGYAQEFSATVLGITRNEADPQSPDMIIDTVALAISGDVVDISDELIGGYSYLAFVSSAGTGSGKTKITDVTPEKTADQSYVYQTGMTVLLPMIGQKLDGSAWTSWDGSAEITAETGQSIVLAIITTATGACVRAGRRTVVASA